MRLLQIATVEKTATAAASAQVSAAVQEEDEAQYFREELSRLESLELRAAGLVNASPQEIIAKLEAERPQLRALALTRTEQYRKDREYFQQQRPRLK